jgi:AP-4 complex subunit epsilon-1
MGAGDKGASENMYAVIDDAMRKANTGHTIGNAIIFECVRTITAIYPNPGLLQSGDPRPSHPRNEEHNVRLPEVFSRSPTFPAYKIL